MSLQMTPTNKQSDDSSNRTPNPVHLQLYCTPIWVKRVTLHQLIHRNLQSEIKQKITALRFFTAFTFGVTRRRSKCGRGNCAPIYFKLAPISDSKIGNKISLLIQQLERVFDWNANEWLWLLFLTPQGKSKTSAIESLLMILTLLRWSGVVTNCTILKIAFN